MDTFFQNRFKRKPSAAVALGGHGRIWCRGSVCHIVRTKKNWCGYFVGPWVSEKCLGVVKNKSTNPLSASQLAVQSVAQHESNKHLYDQACADNLNLKQKLNIFDLKNWKLKTQVIFVQLKPTGFPDRWPLTLWKSGWMFGRIICSSRHQRSQFVSFPTNSQHRFLLTMMLTLPNFSLDGLVSSTLAVTLTIEMANHENTHISCFWNNDVRQAVQVWGSPSWCLSCIRIGVTFESQSSAPVSLEDKYAAMFGGNDFQPISQVATLLAPGFPSLFSKCC